MNDERSDRPALGRDPFEQSDATRAYLDRLDQSKEPQTSLPPPPETVEAFADTDERSEEWLDQLASQLLDDDEDARIALIARELGQTPEISLGFSARATRRTLAALKLIYRYWFRVESEGHSQIPEKGGAILAANHGGLLPFDAAMTVVDLVLSSDRPRLLRSIVDRTVAAMPFVNVFYSRVGQVIGTRENFRQLLRSAQLVLVFPEGTAGIRKRAAQRYVLQDFHVGFVEESLRHRVPIIPTAIIGADDQAPILYDIGPVARLLGLPVFPITPTFPLFGPLGLIPYPVKYKIRYGEPMRFYEEFRDPVPEPEAIRFMAERVRGRIQELVDEGLTRRRGRGD